MKKPIYFMLDKARETRGKILKGVRAPTSLYGGIELEKKGIAKIVDANIKNILKIKSNSVVVVDRAKYILPLKLSGKRIVLIVMNSNHDLSKNKRTIKGLFLHLFYILHYRLCDLIVCLSDTQRKRLKEIGVKNMITLHLGIDEALIKKTKKSRGDFYLSAGGDCGKNHSYVKKALKGMKFKILDGKNPLDYVDYLKVVAKCKGFVLNIDNTRKGSSDLSGSTTCFEALLMKKPIFTNNLPWLKELFKENYYVYKNKKDLRKMLKKNIKFKNINYDYITLNYFESHLLEAIEKI